MGFLGRFGKKAELSVETDKREYVPGEIVTATVRVVGGKKDLEVEEARAELVCENEYEYRDWGGGSGSGSNVSTYTTTERTEHALERFRPAGTIRAGESAAHTVTLTLPTDAVPTGKGEITEVRWKSRRSWAAATRSTLTRMPSFESSRHAAPTPAGRVRSPSSTPTATAASSFGFEMRPTSPPATRSPGRS